MDVVEEDSEVLLANEESAVVGVVLVVEDVSQDGGPLLGRERPALLPGLSSPRVAHFQQSDLSPAVGQVAMDGEQTVRVVGKHAQLLLLSLGELARLGGGGASDDRPLFELHLHSPCKLVLLGRYVERRGP